MITLKDVQHKTLTDGADAVNGGDNAALNVDEAYVSIGDSTVIMAGKKGSIYNDGNDAPLTWLDLFKSEAVDTGVSVGSTKTGGNVLQVTSDLGNGIAVGGGFEDLAGKGTTVGVLSYSSDTMSGHVSIAKGGISSSVDSDDDWKVHAGFSATFDNFKFVFADAIAKDKYNALFSGEVSYNFSYGNWETSYDSTAAFNVPAGSVNWGYAFEGWDAEILDSDVEAKLNFEATADSSFGPAKATIKLLSDYIGNNDANVVVDEAYVSIGEGTILMAGHKGSIYNNGDDAPLNWLGLFNSQAVDVGVKVTTATETSNSIQLTHDLGNGFSLAAGLENLDGNGLAVGVLAYKGDSVSGHVSIDVWDVLHDGGSLGRWDMHAGLTATVDSLKLVAAVASDSENQWNALGSASATFDMFTIAGSLEADDSDYTGAGVSLVADVSEGVKLNIGGRWADYYGDTSYEVAVGAEAAVAENLTLSGAVGYVTEEDWYDSSFTYGWAKLAWAPGGGLTASVKGTVTVMGDNEGNDMTPGETVAATAYKIETEFKKTFE